MNSGYQLNFVIPQGPTGPQGEAIGIAVYGGKYNNLEDDIALTSDDQEQLPLPTSMPGLNVSYDTPNSIVVNQSGIYEINYYALLSTSIVGTVTITVRINGIDIPSTAVKRTLAMSTRDIFNGSVIVELTANDVIDIGVVSSIYLRLSLEDDANVRLTVKKIN